MTHEARRSHLVRLFPILGWLPGYGRSSLPGDLLAGIVIVCLLVPEGMAYAQIAGMPPQTAFYVSQALEARGLYP